MRKIALSLLAAFAGCVLWASDNLDYGTPAADCVVDRTGYALGYSEEHEQAAWVMYRMTREETLTRAAVRTDDFREDPNIVTFSALPSDYSRSGYDRGHLAPAEDMKFSEVTMRESFYMSNMSPQKPDFNRGVTRAAPSPCHPSPRPLTRWSARPDSTSSQDSLTRMRWKHRPTIRRGNKPA